jgi:hypothetical protein
MTLRFQTLSVQAKNRSETTGCPPVLGDLGESGHLIVGGDMSGSRTA